MTDAMYTVSLQIIDSIVKSLLTSISGLPQAPIARELMPQRFMPTNFAYDYAGACRLGELGSAP